MQGYPFQLFLFNIVLESEERNKRHKYWDKGVNLLLFTARLFILKKLKMQG